MAARCALFGAWALIGGVTSYGFLYAFTPYGAMILGFCLFAGLALPEAGGRRWPENLGLLAGPGLFLLLVSYTADDAAAGMAGAAIVATVSGAYLLVGRARCARAA